MSSNWTSTSGLAPVTVRNAMWRNVIAINASSPGSNCSWKSGSLALITDSGAPSLLVRSSTEMGNRGSSPLGLEDRRGVIRPRFDLGVPDVAHVLLRQVALLGDQLGRLVEKTIGHTVANDVLQLEEAEQLWQRAFEELLRVELALGDTVSA